MRSRSPRPCWPGPQRGPSPRRLLRRRPARAIPGPAGQLILGGAVLTGTPASFAAWAGSQFTGGPRLLARPGRQRRPGGWRRARRAWTGWSARPSFSPARTHMHRLRIAPAGADFATLAMLTWTADGRLAVHVAPMELAWLLPKIGPLTRSTRSSRRPAGSARCRLGSPGHVRTPRCSRTVHRAGGRARYRVRFRPRRRY